MTRFPPDQRILILLLALDHRIAAAESGEEEVASPGEAEISTWTTETDTMTLETAQPQNVRIDPEAGRPLGVEIEIREMRGTLTGGTVMIVDLFQENTIHTLDRLALPKPGHVH